jgi:hypothetical protein
MGLSTIDFEKSPKIPKEGNIPESGSAAERNDQNYACPMPYDNASSKLSESHYFSSFAYCFESSHTVNF